ncbi:MAG: sulfatase-like hydrolase/transferase [Flavobacteriaceae bacterium]|jgi:arylsulfatase A-like enzyme|nr:sulfatase-like hydrolase/transferase [Flavobacteriaceae bacterium]MBT6127352.1 sulfatase-like hydrolase/transferase [Flavobacteriaceae bacterium]
MKPFLTPLLISILVLACQPPESKTPNIILIMADDQGWGDVGFNGHPHLNTPHLDAMSQNGAVFSRFYSAGSVCSPTRASVMTGRHPARMGICSANCGHVKDQEITLAEMVKEKGYRTGHFGKWHLGTLTRDVLDANRGGRKKNDIHYAPPWDHGFDVSFVTESKVPTWDPMITPTQNAEDVKASLVEGRHFGTYYWTGPGQQVTENLRGDDSRVIMDRVIPFVEESAAKGQAFLSVVWFHAPHLPVLTGDKYKPPYAHLSEGQQHYYGVISALDEQVGRLRNKLKSLGIADNTLVFYTSDNGPETSLQVRDQNIPHGRAQGITKGLRGRKRSLHEGGIRVPGIVEWPGKIKAGTQIDTPCFTSDYFPTIAHILGIDLEKYQRPYDGENLMPYWKGQKQIRSHPLAFQFGKQYALIDNQHKMYGISDGSIQLFDLLNDPSEEKDLSKAEPVLLKRLRSKYQDWNTSIQNSQSGKDY